MKQREDKKYLPSTRISYEDEDIGFTSCNTSQNPSTMFAVWDPHFDEIHGTWMLTQ